MKKLFLSAIAVVLAGSAYAIPNTFSEGDIVSAEKMNENFQHLEQQLQGAIEKAVNCAAGEKIGKAIDDGYTNITVSGTCTENLQFSMWREDSAENGTPTGKLAPRFLRIAGADASAKIVDASSNAESTVSVTDGATLLLEAITISGGQYAVNAQRNTNLYLSGVTIENFTERGIRAVDGNWLGIDDDGVIIKGTGSAGYGIEVGLGASGWIADATISGVERGINAHGGATLYIKNYDIAAASRGVNVANSRFLKYSDGSASIEGTSDRAVSVDHGVFTNWDGNLEIKNLSGGQGINFWMSQGNISNLKMPDFDNTGTGWNPALSIGGGSSVNINGAEITGSTDGALVSISDSSITGIRDSTLTVGSAEAGLELGGSSRLRFHNSTISGSVTDNLVSISDGSSAEIRDQSTLTITSGERGMRVAGSSRLNFRNSTISGSVTDNLVKISDSSNAEIRESTVTATTSKTWNSGIYLSDASGLKLLESTVEASHRGMAVERNSYAEMRNGSSVTAGASSAVTVYGGAGLKIRSGSSLVSTGNSAINISQGSWTEIDGGDGSTINRTDDGEDIGVGTMSLLSIYDGNSIGEVGCYSKGYVSANEGTVTTLADSCTE